MNTAQAFEFFCRCLHTQPSVAERPGLLQQVHELSDQWPRMVTRAGELMISPALASGFRRWDLQSELQTEVWEYFDSLHHLNRLRNQRIVGQLREIAATLQRAGIDPVFLKGGAHLVSGLFAASGDRFIRDIDFLVAPAEAERAASALRAIGYVEPPRPYEKSPPPHHLPELAHPDREVCVEIHHALMGEQQAVISDEAVLRDAVSINASGQPLRIPSLAHRALHHVLHIQLHHGNHANSQVSLPRLLDWEPLSAQLTAEQQWGEVTGPLRDHEALHYLQSYAFLAEQLLGIPLPSEIARTTAARQAYWHLQLAQRFPAMTRLTVGMRHALWLGGDLLCNSSSRRRWSRRLLSRQFYAELPRRWQAVMSKAK